MMFIHHICRYRCKLITHTLTQNLSNLSSCKRVITKNISFAKKTNKSIAPKFLKYV